LVTSGHRHFGSTTDNSHPFLSRQNRSHNQIATHPSLPFARRHSRHFLATATFTKALADILATPAHAVITTAAAVSNSSSIMIVSCQ
jgi:hypothetical protein